MQLLHLKITDKYKYMCEVCKSKDSEISFLRQTISNLLAYKEVTTTTFTPVYHDDYGNKIEDQKEENFNPVVVSDEKTQLEEGF